ncbi:MAG: UPF0280 family protein [Candidatus Omnitrophota bacterium]
MYQERFYRNWSPSAWSLEVSHKESDLFIASDKPIDRSLAYELLKKYYEEIEKYIKGNPLFFTSLSPLEQDNGAPPIVKDMIDCSNVTGIGPFASVAGAVALYVGKELSRYSNEIIIENGGDIFLNIAKDKIVGVYLGERFSQPVLSLRIKHREYAFGIASSSAYIGHSLNFGRADLVTVIAKDAVLADGFATALSNQIKKEKDIEAVLERVKQNLFIEGLLIAFEGHIALWGALELNG